MSPRRGRSSALVTDSASDAEATPSPKRGRAFARRGRGRRPANNQILLLQEDNDSEKEAGPVRGRPRGVAGRRAAAAEGRKRKEKTDSLSEDDDVPLKKLVVKVSWQYVNLAFLIKKTLSSWV